jgi:transglutaminase-like putative cysteine protease
MKIVIRHETVYAYDAPVRSLTQYLRLVPRDTARQKVIAWKLDTPAPTVRTQDGYGNVLDVLTIDKPVTEVRIVASGTVQTSAAVDEPSDFTGPPLSPLLFLRATGLTLPDPAITTLAEGFRPSAYSLAGLRALATRVRERIRPRIGEPGFSPRAGDALAEGSGPPPDLAHAFIACCRHLGVPARYACGYVYMPERGADPSVGHSWAEAWVEKRWHSFDVALGDSIGERHVKVAMGGDHLDACPIRGMRIGGGNETMTVRAQVRQQQQN